MKEAIVVLDAQQIYTNKESDLYCGEAEKTIARINNLIEHSLSQSRLIVLVRHIHKLDGSDLGRLFDFSGEAEDDFNFKEGSEEVEFDRNLIRPKGAVELKKTRYSAFAGTNLDVILRQHKISKVIICGFMTNFCCESTARDALDRDFYVDFVIDATGTPGTDKYNQRQVREIVSELLGAGIARILKTKELLSQSKEG